MGCQLCPSRGGHFHWLPNVFQMGREGTLNIAREGAKVFTNICESRLLYQGAENTLRLQKALLGRLLVAVSGITSIELYNQYLNVQFPHTEASLLL